MVFPNGEPGEAAVNGDRITAGTRRENGEQAAESFAGTVHKVPAPARRAVSGGDTPVREKILPLRDDIEVSAEIGEKWRALLDVLSEVMHIPAALVMRVHADEIEVFERSGNPGNVYKKGERAKLGTGLYCEEVMSSRKLLTVPDATKDPRWDHNPDIKLGMISYMGYPILWPGGEVFGTICVLDTKENSYTPVQRRLLEQFRETVQGDLAMIREKEALSREIEEHRLTDASLRASEERFRRLAEEARDVIYRMSLPDGRYEYVSPGARDMMEISPEELYDNPALFRDIIHPDWLDYFNTAWGNLLRGECPSLYEFQIVTKSGAVKWVNQRNVLVRDAEGRPVELEGIVSDVTERVTREQRVRRYMELLSGLIGNTRTFFRQSAGGAPGHHGAGGPHD